MRRIDGRGEKELRRARTVIWLRIASRESGWNRIKSCSSVIRRVLEGGDGWESGGMVERSIERDGREVCLERDSWKEGNDPWVETEFIMVVCWSWRKLFKC